MSNSPEGDGFEGPLCHSTSLLNLGGLEMMGHVLEPQQGAVGGSKEQTLKGGYVLGLQFGIHQLSLSLHQGLLRRFLRLLKLMARLFLGLTDGGDRKSSVIDQSVNTCVKDDELWLNTMFLSASPCYFCRIPLRHWTRSPALQGRSSGSSVPHPRRSLLLLAAWTAPQSCAPPAERN